MAGVADWWPDGLSFIVRKGDITTWVLAVGLLENSFIANCFCSKQSERTILENWCVTVLFGMEVFLKVAKDDKS